MLVLLPVSHDSMTARRWPWVTFVIISINCAVHVAQQQSAAVLEVEQAARRAFEYHRRHPDLRAKPPLDRLERNTGLAPAAEDPSGVPAERSAERQQQQAELDSLADELGSALQQLPVFKYGYEPAKPRLRSLITYQFLHGGWLHLLFNMWFLWLVGCYVEDVWGRWLFPTFYLSAGVVAALAHQLANLHSEMPLIGASGAVAGAMGAFMVRFLRTRIRFWYLFFLLRGSFQAPAYVMLPLWLGTQVHSAATDTGDGVAYLAHVGGFVFGVGIALWVRASGHEQRVDAAIEQEQTWTEEPLLIEAGRDTDQGHYRAALEKLGQLLRTNPHNLEVHREHVRAANGLRERALQARAYAGAIAVHSGELPDVAVELFQEAQRLGCAARVPRALQLRLGRHLATRGDVAGAGQLYQRLYANDGADAPGLHALIAHGDLALAVGDFRMAAELYGRAELAPYPHSELEVVLRQKKNRVMALDRARASAAPAPTEPSEL